MRTRKGKSNAVGPRPHGWQMSGNKKPGKKPKQ